MSESESKSGTEPSVDRIVHAPGTWSLLCDEARGRPRCLVVNEKGDEIASVNPYRESWNQDAELIAAAPVMREALQAILVETNFISLDAVRSYVAELLEFAKVV